MQPWTGVAVVAATLAVAAICGVVLRRSAGSFRRTGDEAPPGTAALALDPVLAGLGVTRGTPVTLLQFSSAFCAPCRTTRVLCADVARTVPGVRHVEVDADSHLDAVRALGIWRTPTVLVIDPRGVVVRRATGAPTRTQLLGVVGDVLPNPSVTPAVVAMSRQPRPDLRAAGWPG